MQIASKVILLTIIGWALISCSNIIAAPYSLEYDKDIFDPVAKEIIGQNFIFEMDDFTRYSKWLNGIRIRTIRERENDYDYTRFIDSVADSLKICKTIIENFRMKLEKTKLRAFYKCSDSLLFIVDGFLDNAWGYFYSEKLLQNDSTQFKFGNNYVRYMYDVNSHWKKVVIH
jgi:hypothetical protein